MKVSVVMITYGHEKYLIEAIQGVLNQEVNFEIELIVVNDNSPDNTEDIVSNFLKNHPQKHLIKYHKHIQNKGMMPNFIWALNQVKGEFVALCDGDDYWTDPLKLQKQIDFLEKNTDFSICFTDYVVYNQNSDTYSYPDLIEKHKHKTEFSKNEIILDNFVPTVTAVYRNRPEVLAFLHKELFPGDWFLHILNSLKGNIKFLPFKSAVYRKNDGGVCSASDPILNNSKYLKSIEIFRKQFKNDYKLQLLFIASKIKIHIHSLKFKLKLILKPE